METITSLESEIALVEYLGADTYIATLKYLAAHILRERTPDNGQRIRSEDK